MTLVPSVTTIHTPPHMDLRYHILEINIVGVAPRPGVSGDRPSHRPVGPPINSMFILIYEFERSAVCTVYALPETSMRNKSAMRYDWDAPLDPAPRSKNLIVGYSITFIVGAILLVLPLIFLA
jgi:hypothetical protein